ISALYHTIHNFLIKSDVSIVGLVLTSLNSDSKLQLKTVFSSFKDVKVIQFSSMQDAFHGFTDKTREEKFRNRVKRYVGIWCCVDYHIPGHIYYDMYWEEKPGWKPVPPQTPEDDHLPL
ncbi:arabinosyltransferase XEG113-like, partial [Hibiscus syriacus]|uniref:arabinosyltransferase XEG113-like n=1 Tax=Hibiscus syriacus TaxID=106335 RepID=UPI0019208E6C